MVITANKTTKRLGDLLVEKGLITEEQVKEALQIQRDTRTDTESKLLGDILIEKGYVTNDDIILAIQDQMSIEKVVLSDRKIPDSVLKVFNDVNFLKQNQCMPFEIENGLLKIAMTNPLQTQALDYIKLQTGLKVESYITTVNDVNAALDKYFGSAQMQTLVEEFDDSDFVTDVNEEVDDTNEDAPMIRLVNAIFEQAVHCMASDIHIEPMENYIRVRYRVDGDLVEQKSKYPSKFLGGITSRIKIMGNMNIAEKRRPQDGRITVKVDGVEYDVRVSILPTSQGEKVVMRLTNKERLTMDKSNLGLQPEDEAKFDNLLKNSRGIILVTGLTGSGKSTTLYTALSELNTEKVNISTIEDPVEADIDGINQVQVNEKSGVTFPSALRCFLRQDPDIIMVGEIRDTETASLAIDASLTGHLVVSTLHTNSSVSSISRLEKMGIEPYLLADATVGILAQRLVKRLCTCKKQKKITIRDRKKLGIGKEEEITLYEPCGCVKCNGTGYKGRIAVYEILVFTEELKEAIADERPLNEIEDIAMKQGLQTLKMSAIKLIKQGITTVEELDRIVHEPDIEMDLEEENNE